jgi:hypothetical protein
VGTALTVKLSLDQTEKCPHLAKKCPLLGKIYPLLIRKTGTFSHLAGIFSPDAGIFTYRPLSFNVVLYQLLLPYMLREIVFAILHG